MNFFFLRFVITVVAMMEMRSRKPGAGNKAPEAPPAGIDTLGHRKFIESSESGLVPEDAAAWKAPNKLTRHALAHFAR